SQKSSSNTFLQTATSKIVAYLIEIIAVISMKAIFISKVVEKMRESFSFESL
ncbi:10764_t:CDS:1, partial [Gigaspora rosea]